LRQFLVNRRSYESITDPDVSTGWYDSSGFENGDECNFIFGTTLGAPGQFYNQVINGHHYLTHEEFSNSSFFGSGGGCLQSWRRSSDGGPGHCPAAVACPAGPRSCRTCWLLAVFEVVTSV
jgi:hypothetical protein